MPPSPIAAHRRPAEPVGRSRPSVLVAILLAAVIAVVAIALVAPSRRFGHAACSPLGFAVDAGFFVALFAALAAVVPAFVDLAVARGRATAGAERRRDGGGDGSVFETVGCGDGDGGDGSLSTTGATSLTGSGRLRRRSARSERRKPAAQRVGQRCISPRVAPFGSTTVAKRPTPATSKIGSARPPASDTRATTASMSSTAA